MPKSRTQKVSERTVVCPGCGSEIAYSHLARHARACLLKSDKNLQELLEKIDLIGDLILILVCRDPMAQTLLEGRVGRKQKRLTKAKRRELRN